MEKTALYDVIMGTGSSAPTQIGCKTISMARPSKTALFFLSLQTWMFQQGTGFTLCFCNEAVNRGLKDKLASASRGE